MIRRFASKPSLLTMTRKSHRQKMLHREYNRHEVSVFHQISRSARSVFDTKRRSNREQPKRHRSDDIGDFEKSRPWPKSLIEEIKEMLKIEEHHVVSFEEITNVEWCPKFVKPEIHGHVRGGKDLLHHRCRDCGRLCLHLLGLPGSKRQCLKCSGKWDKKYIAEWYYHSACKYCWKK